MNKTKLLFAAILGLLVLNAGMLIWLFRGQPHAPAPPARPDAAAFIISELKLDAGQQVAFDRLKKEHRQQMRRLRDENRDLHDRYFALLKTDAPEPDAADPLVAKISATQQAIDRLNFDHFKAIRALCRDDQKKLFDGIIDELANRIGGPPPQGPPGLERPAGPHGNGPPPGPPGDNRH